MSSSPEHGHNAPPAITTPAGRELFPSYIPPHIRALSEDRRMDLYGSLDTATRIDNPVHLGIPHSGSGHHPEQNRRERNTLINGTVRDDVRIKGLNDYEVRDNLLSFDEERRKAQEKLLNYNPRAFLQLRSLAVSSALKRNLRVVSSDTEDYLTAVQLAHVAQYDGDEQDESAAAIVKREILVPKSTNPQYAKLRESPLAQVIADAPHLRNSRKDMRLLNKMRARRHGKIDHSNGSLAAAFSKEHLEHTIHSLSGSDNKAWKARVLRQKVDLHEQSDRPDVAKSVKKYERYLKGDVEAYQRLTYGDRKLGIKRKGIMSFVDQASESLKGRASRIGKLETKKQTLDEAIQQKAEQKEAKKQEKAERREQRKTRREKTHTAPIPLNPIETTATEVIPIAPVSPEPHFEPTTLKSETERLESLSGTLKIKVGGEVFEDAIIVTSGTAKSAKTGEDVRAYVVEYTDAAGVKQTKQVSEARLSAWNAKETDD